MSKNIVDSVIEVAEKQNEILALIPSRRQIDFFGGYSNNWKTKDLHEYVKSKTNNVLLVRDHGGPKQGTKLDYGFDSFYDDCKYLDIIHIDPWKCVDSFEQGMNKTLEYINFCHNINPNIFFEVGTEESIYHYEAAQLDEFIDFLKNNLSSSCYNQIKYVVIQSGTSILKTSNVGIYSEKRLKDMILVCNNHNLLSKEHNGDYLSENNIKEKFKAGLSAINIAPEFGQIETNTILNALYEGNHTVLIEKFYQLCVNSQKWQQWVGDNFNPNLNKKEIIKITGHYIFSNPNFEIIKRQLKGINKQIKNNIKKKIINLIN